MEPSHFEAAMNGNVNEFPFCDINKADMSDIFVNKVSPSGNSLLHVVASSGKADITELIVRHFPSLITQKNNEGDTALHVAARAGKLSTAKILVDRAREFANSDTLLKMTNDQGNTALHEALFGLLVQMNNTKDKASNNNVDLLVALARYLVEEVQELSYYYQKNDAGLSPLCLAIDCSNKDFLEYFLRALGGSSVDGLEGKRLMQVMLDKKNHASTGYLKLVRCLLEIKSDGDLERNKEGLYPLHVACENGYIQVMKELLRQWPYATELVSPKSQTILHVAAKSGKEKVVRYILKQKYSDKLINKMDKDGNTALHLAALHSHSLVVATLMWDKRSVSELKNNHGQTAYDVAKKQYEILDTRIDEGKNVHGKVPEQPVSEKIVNNNDESSNQKPPVSEVDHQNKSKESDLLRMSMTFSILFVSHYPGFFNLLRLWIISFNKLVQNLRRKREGPLRTDDFKERINSLLVMATIIVAATFGASHQLPDTHSGADKTALSLFLFCDNIYLSVSVVAAIILCWTQLVDIKLAYLVILGSSTLLGIALLSMSIAFCCAIFIGLNHFAGWFIILNSIVQVIALISMFFLSIPLFVPFRRTDPLTPMGYFFLFVIFRISDRIVSRIERSLQRDD